MDLISYENWQGGQPFPLHHPKPVGSRLELLSLCSQLGICFLLAICPYQDATP